MNHKKKSTGVWEQINFPKTRRIGPFVDRACVSKGEIQTKSSCGLTKAQSSGWAICFFICWLPPVPQKYASVVYIHGYKSWKRRLICSTVAGISVTGHLLCCSTRQCHISWWWTDNVAEIYYICIRYSRTHLRDGLEYAAVAKYKTRNRKNRRVGALLAAQGAERFVSWQGDSVFGNLIKMLQTHLKL